MTCITASRWLRPAAFTLGLLAGAASQAALPDDMAPTPSASRALPSAPPAPPAPAHPTFKVVKLALVCTKEFVKGQALMRLQFTGSGVVNGAQIRLSPSGSSNPLATWALPNGTASPSTVYFTSPPVPVTMNAPYSVSFLTGTPPAVYAPYTQTVIAPVCKTPSGGSDPKGSLIEVPFKPR